MFGVIAYDGGVMNNQLNLGLDDITINVKPRKQPRPYDFKGVREYNKAARCHFFPVGESVIENMLNRYNRPKELYRQYIPQVIQAVKDRCKLPVAPELTFRWSQKAGCSCGCSPGFIVDGLSHYDIFVNIGKSKADELKEYILGDH